MRLIIISITALCLIATQSISAADKVLISVIHRDNGLNDLFVAKKGTRTLWTYNALGTILRDEQSGASVLESTDLIVVDEFGTVKNRLSLTAASDPRYISLNEGYLIYDTGNVAVVPYNASKEGAHLAAWLREVRHVHAYNVRDWHTLWEAPESDIGLPIACKSGRVDTLKIVNLTKCLENRKVTPVVAINEINVKNGHRIRFGILSVKQSQAFDLLGSFLYWMASVPPAEVKWSDSGVSVRGLFGKHYTGKFERANYPIVRFLNEATRRQQNAL